MRTSDGFYFRAEGGGGSTLDATATSSGLWERLTVRRMAGDGIVRTGDLVTLQTVTGHYLVAEEGGGGPVNADRTAAGPWETFAVIVR